MVRVLDFALERLINDRDSDAARILILKYLRSGERDRRVDAIIADILDPDIKTGIWTVWKRRAGAKASFGMGEERLNRLFSIHDALRKAKAEGKNHKEAFYELACKNKEGASDKEIDKEERSLKALWKKRGGNWIDLYQQEQAELSSDHHASK
jgi:hypothetical protein